PLADRPDGPFGQADAWAPGEVMQMDSTPLDVLVRLDDGVVGRVDLTGMIDVATRTVTAAVLRPATKPVDASVLLARTVTPEPMRPGWADALAMSRSALPWRRLLGIDARLEHAAARPVIIPETIVVDQGKVFVSRNFRASCNFLGINFQPVHGRSGWERATSNGCWDQWARCSPSSWPDMPASTPNGGARAPGSRQCGPCRSCRSCWMNGSWRPGRTAPTAGCATPPIPERCSARTRSTPRWSRR